MLSFSYLCGMDDVFDNNACFALTAHASGEPSKLYTPVTIMNLEKVIVVQANAMWDTGAEICVMSKRLADALQLEVAPGPSARGLTGAAATSLCYAYVSFVASGGIVTAKCAVVDDYVGGFDYSVIIGLNLIRRGSLAVSGGDTGITLSFRMPASEVIDFADSSDAPSSILPLSDGRERLKIYSGIDALRLMNRATPRENIRKR